MKTYLLILLVFSCYVLQAQSTAGQLDISVRTLANGESYSPRHVLAVWIEDDAGNFVKTLKLNAANRKKYLYTWISSSSENTTDATTGATLNTHLTHELIWNCTDVSGELVPDGNYSLKIEYTSAHAQGPLLTVDFAKSGDPQNIQPTDENYFKDISLQFTPEIPYGETRAFRINEKLGRGVNLGNGFESPRENSWGLKIKEEYLALISEVGFSHIRLPVRWNDWAADFAPYTIEQEFLDTVTKVIDAALKNKLHVVLNIHHYDDFNDNPTSAQQLERFTAIWKQLSSYYKDYPDSLLFEFLNEPHQNMNSFYWNKYYKQVLDTVRVENPTRICVVGPPDWNNVNSVDKLEWTADTNMILTVHYYNPFQFTHQGASWVGDNADSWLGTTWDSTNAQLQAVVDDFENVRAFSLEHNVPVHVGEFGAYSKADDVSRRKWTSYLARKFEAFGFSWAYWEFGAGFGVYDPDFQIWRNFLLNALTEQTDPYSIPPDPWDLINGNFRNDEQGWSLNVNSPATADFSEVNEEARIEVSAIDDKGWSVQFSQYDISLIQGAEYRVSFEAWTSGVDAYVNTYLRRSSEPLEASGYHGFDLNSQKQRFSYEFTLENPSDDNVRMTFDLGYSVATVFLDSIVLEQLSIPVLIEEIVISPEAPVIDLKSGSVQLIAEVIPDSANNKSLSWELVRGADLATLSAEGLLTATGLSDGEVWVKASSNDGSGISAQVKVQITNQLQVESISLNPTKTLIDTYQGNSRIFFEILPVNASNKTLLWELISGRDIAEVSQTGFFEALGTGDGEVLVKASSTDGSEISDQVSITLTNQILIETVEIVSSSLVIDVLKGSLQLEAIITPEKASRKNLSWKVVEGESKADIDSSGLLKASGNGNGDISVKATAMDGSGAYDEVVVTLSNQGSVVFSETIDELKTVLNGGRLIVSYGQLPEKGSLKLYSITGSMIFSQEIPAFSHKTQIKTDGFSEGLYMLLLKRGDKKNVVPVHVFSE